MAMQVSSGAGYLLPNAMPVARPRLALLSEIYDPASRVALARTGLAPGWRCWEIGAGNGSVAAWLAQQVGETGHVIATDLDPRMISRIENVDLLVHNVATDPPPGSEFDLIHTRLLLCHLPEREAVLARLVKALKPGGWLVVEDFDGMSMPADRDTSPDETPLRTHAGLRELFRRRGVETRTGRLLPGWFKALGLLNVHAEGKLFMAHGGTDAARFQRLTFESIREDLIAQQLVPLKQFEADLATLDTDYLAPTPIMWSVSGQRPA